MYAIVDIAGQQFKVEKENKLFVHRLQGEEGSTVDFDKILLIDNKGEVSVGDPIVKNKVIRAKILAHVKGDKVKIFKKKRRKGYQVLNGHRQYFTELVIQGIFEQGTVETEKEEKPAEKSVATSTEKKTTTVKASEKKSSAAGKKKETATKAKTGATPKKTGTTPKAKTGAAPKATTAKPVKKKDADKKEV